MLGLPLMVFPPPTFVKVLPDRMCGPQGKRSPEKVQEACLRVQGWIQVNCWWENFSGIEGE